MTIAEADVGSSSGVWKRLTEPEPVSHELRLRALAETAETCFEISESLLQATRHFHAVVAHQVQRRP